jgi:hypothetical protein
LGLLEVTEIDLENLTEGDMEVLHLAHVPDSRDLHNAQKTVELVLGWKKLLQHGIGGLLNWWMEWEVYRLDRSLIHRLFTSYRILESGSSRRGIIIFSNTSRKKHRTVSNFVLSSSKNRDILNEKSRSLLEWGESGRMSRRMRRKEELKTLSRRLSKSGYNEEGSTSESSEVENPEQKKGSLDSGEGSFLVRFTGENKGCVG